MDIMETEKEINAKILAITMQIQTKHPELSKLLEEMPVTIPNESSPEINRKVLSEYYESLKSILRQYS
jgi:hypothetical protein